MSVGQAVRPATGRRLLVGGLLFLVSVLAVRAATSGLDAASVPALARDFATLAVSVVIESVPFVILGILLSIVVQVWLPQSAIMRMLPRHPALRRLVLASLGVLLPVCECGNMPLARGLMVRGLSVSESMTFLVAAPIVNPVTIITTYQAFGFDDGILVARIAGGFVVAYLVGWLFSAHPRPDSLITARFAESCRTHADHGHGGRVDQSIALFRGEATALLPALLLGAAAAALVQVAVPREVLLRVGSDPLWSLLAMMLLALIISVCSTVDAFFVLPFANAFLPGSIVAFLVFGPIIDLKMLALMRTTFRTRTLVQLTVVVGLFAAALGSAVNALA